MATKKVTPKKPAFNYRTIKLPEDAFKKTGTDITILDELSKLPEKFSFLTTCMILAVIFEAVNDGWVPDFSNQNQARYYPWAWILSSGLGFSFTFCNFDNAYSVVGSRLCTYDPKISKYVFEQFPELWKHWLLNIKPK